MSQYLHMLITIKLLREGAQLPNYQTSGSAASDITACIDKPITLSSGERIIVPTGFAIAVPDGYEAQIRARSGLSTKHGIALVNGIGTIDSDYRGEVGVALINLSNEPFTVEPGMRIAQMVVAPCLQVGFDVVEDLDQTERGKGGYGSTGH